MNRKIFKEAVEKWSKQYREQPEQRERYIVDRLHECHDKWVKFAYEEFNKKHETSIPIVVIGKHFSWVLINKINSIGFNRITHYAMELYRENIKSSLIYMKMGEIFR